MGVLGAKQGSRGGGDPVRMADLLEWWTDLEKNSGRSVRFVMKRGPVAPDGGCYLSAELYDESLDEWPAAVARYSLPWPTRSHKTVLGAMLWLLVQLGDVVDADAALDGLTAPGD